MIFVYLLISVMPLIRHPLWSDLIGDVTVVKYLGLPCLLYAALYAGTRTTPITVFPAWPNRLFVALAVLGMTSYAVYGVWQPIELSPLASYLSFLLFLLIVVVVVDSEDRFRWSMLVAIGSVTFASMHVVREWQKYGGMAAGYRPGWVTGDPNYFSVSALLCLPIALYAIGAQRPQWERAFCAVSLALTLVALSLAASRGAFLGLTGGMVYVVVRSKRRVRNLILALLILAPLLVVAPSSPLERLTNPSQSDQESTDIRTALLVAGLRMFRENLVTGIGAGNFKPLVGFFSDPDEDLHHIAHNTYVEIAAEMGVPGIGLFLGILVTTFATLWRIERDAAASNNDFARRMAMGMQAGLISYCIAIFFLSAQAQKLFWLMIFLACALRTLVPRQAPSVEVAMTSLKPRPALSGARK